MASERNALAELAHWLECDTRTLETASVAQLNRIRKAQRIVAALAKVRDCTFKGNPRVDQSADAVIVCRAIAEEGVEDVK